MLDFLFGEGQYGLRFLFAFIVVLGLIGLFAWLARRFGASNLGATAARGRQPRLAVIDAAAIDARRRLVLIRRDNVEHLLIIGGPTDVVVEQNIVRGGAVREGGLGDAVITEKSLGRLGLPPIADGLRDGGGGLVGKIAQDVSQSGVKAKIE